MARRRRISKFIEPLPRPKSKKEFAAMLYQLFGFMPPAVAVCPGHSAPLDVLWDIYNQEHTNYVVVAARKSGKTMGIAALQVLFALTYERLDSCDIAATMNQAQVCYEHSRSFLFSPKGELGKVLIPKYILDEGTKREIQLRTGSRIFISSGDVRGVNAIHPHKLFIDEVELLKGWHVIQEALPAPHTEGEKLRQIVFISSWKYRGGLLDRVIQTFKDDPGTMLAFWCGFEAMQPIPDCSFCKSLKRTLSDGRVVTFEEFCKLPDGTCKGKRARGFISLVDVRNDFLGMDETTFRAQWLTQRPQESGLKVFYIPPTARLTKFQPLPGYPLYAGVDYGKVSAIVVCQILPTGHIVVFDEYVRYNLSPREVALLCFEIAAQYRRQYGCRLEMFVIDARNFYIFEREFAELGLPAVAPPLPGISKTEEKRSRVSIVNSLLIPDFDTGLPRLLIVPSRTPVLISQMLELTYRTDADGQPTEEIPDGNDHCSDALLYLISYIYVNQLHRQVEISSAQRPETYQLLGLLQNLVERYVPDAAQEDDRLQLDPNAILAEKSVNEAVETVRDAVRSYVQGVVRQFASNMNMTVRPDVVDRIAEKTMSVVEDYIHDNISAGVDPVSLIYKMPKEVEEKLLQAAIQELDAAQMRLGFPNYSDYLMWEMLHETLLGDIMRGMNNPPWGGGPLPPFGGWF